MQILSNFNLFPQKNKIINLIYHGQLRLPNDKKKLVFLLRSNDSLICK